MEEPKSNWFKELYNKTWYVQLAIVILLIVIWLLGGIPN